MMETAPDGAVFFTAEKLKPLTKPAAVELFHRLTQQAIACQNEQQPREIAEW
mgnify:CR=1 FL=1